MDTSKADAANERAKQRWRDMGMKLPEDSSDKDFMKEIEATIPKKEKK